MHTHFTATHYRYTRLHYQCSQTKMCTETNILSFLQQEKQNFYLDLYVILGSAMSVLFEGHIYECPRSPKMTSDSKRSLATPNAKLDINCCYRLVMVL